VSLVLPHRKLQPLKGAVPGTVPFFNGLLDNSSPVLREYWRGISAVFLADYFWMCEITRIFGPVRARPSLNARPEFWNSGGLLFCDPQKRGENSTDRPQPPRSQPPQLWRTTFPLQVKASLQTFKNLLHFRLTCLQPGFEFGRRRSGGRRHSLHVPSTLPSAPAGGHRRQRLSGRSW